MEKTGWFLVARDGDDRYRVTFTTTETINQNMSCLVEGNINGLRALLTTAGAEDRNIAAAIAELRNGKANVSAGKASVDLDVLNQLQFKHA